MAYNDCSIAPNYTEGTVTFVPSDTGVTFTDPEGKTLVDFAFWVEVVWRADGTKEAVGRGAAGANPAWLSASLTQSISGDGATEGVAEFTVDESKMASTVQRVRIGVAISDGEEPAQALFDYTPHAPGVTFEGPVVDDFNGNGESVALADHQPGTVYDTGWEEVQGSWAVLPFGGRARATSSKTADAVILSGTPDVKITANASWDDATNFVRQGILCRYVDADNWIWVRCYPYRGSEGFRVVECVGGSRATLYDDGDFGEISGRSDMTVTLQGSTLSWSFEGKSGSVQVSLLDGDRHGVRFEQNNGDLDSCDLYRYEAQPV